MSRLVVRRLTLAIALVAMLGLAMPASAAGHPQAAKAPAASSSLFDQLLSWIGSLWSVQHPDAQGPMKGAGISLPLPGGNSAPYTSKDVDKSAQIDPNG